LRPFYIRRLLYTVTALLPCATLKNNVHVSKAKFNENTAHACSGQVQVMTSGSVLFQCRTAIVHSSTSEWLAVEVESPLCTFLCRRKLETTEKWRPQPSTSQANGFSPVWLYMCVCKELGLVNRLSQTLHLCFFCVLADILEENWPIID